MDQKHLNALFEFCESTKKHPVVPEESIVALLDMIDLTESLKKEVGAKLTEIGFEDGNLISNVHCKRKSPDTALVMVYYPGDSWKDFFEISTLRIKKGFEKVIDPLVLKATEYNQMKRKNKK
jgi:hypothetical protein